MKVSRAMAKSSTPTLDPARLEGHILQNTYKVEELVGEGGMALVYLATHTVLDGPVAVKVLRSEYYRREEHRERFLREARSQFHINHPNVVRVFDFLQDRGVVGFAQEWCNNGDLKRWLDKRKKPCSNKELTSLFVPLLDGLEEAHQQGMIHRDIKPHNILLQRKGSELSLKLNDFGLVKVLEADDMTRSGVMMGTLHYMSPEQFEEAKHVDHRSDIYSLGVLLYQLSTLRLPFSGKMPHLALKIMNQEPAPPTEASESLQKVLLRCLKKKPSARFSSIAEFRSALLEALGQVPPEAVISSISVPSSRTSLYEATEPPTPSPPLPTVSPPRSQSDASSDSGQTGKGSWEQTLVTQTGSLSPSVEKQGAANGTSLLRWMLLVLVLTGVSVGAYFGLQAWKGNSSSELPKLSPSQRKKLSLKKSQFWPSSHSFYLGGFRLLTSAKEISRGDYGLSRYQLRHTCVRARNAFACYHAAVYAHHLMYFLRISCEQKDVTSCHWFKLLTKRGRTHQQNFQRSIPWYRRACRYGSKKSCAILKKHKVEIAK